VRYCAISAADPTTPNVIVSGGSGEGDDDPDGVPVAEADWELSPGLELASELEDPQAVSSAATKTPKARSEVPCLPPDLDRTVRNPNRCSKDGVRRTGSASRRVAARSG
jgi:hypothetical protein